MTEQRKRVMAWAHEKIKTDTLNGAIHEYMLLRPVQNYVPMHRVIRAVLLAQEAEIAEQRTLLERLLRSRVWQGSDPLYLDLIAHLDGPKQFELAYPELPEHANFFDWWASRARLHLSDHVFVDKDSP